MKWISVKESLPELYKKVLVFSQGHDPKITWQEQRTILKTWKDCSTEITHWMELPEPPEKEDPEYPLWLTCEKCKGLSIVPKSEEKEWRCPCGFEHGKKEIFAKFDGRLIQEEVEKWNVNQWTTQNFEICKTFMSAQCTHNDLFMEDIRELKHRNDALLEQISQLESKIKNLEEDFNPPECKTFMRAQCSQNDIFLELIKKLTTRIEIMECFLMRQESQKQEQ